jgi:hypothetical protein
VWPARKADNLTAIREPIVWKTWDPRRLKCYGPPRPITGMAEPLLFVLIIIIIIIIIIINTNCNWAYARWQCYINNEQYINNVHKQ